MSRKIVGLKYREVHGVLETEVALTIADMVCIEHKLVKLSRIELCKEGKEHTATIKCPTVASSEAIRPHGQFNDGNLANLEHTLAEEIIRQVVAEKIDIKGCLH